MTSAPQYTSFYFEDLAVGDEASYSRTVTENDIAAFAEVTGDNNPLHVDPAYAETTMFKGRIAHGILSAGYISAVIGTRLPGPGAIYMGQTLKFRAPVRIGDTVTATITVRELNDAKAVVVFDTVARVGDTVVVDGEATIKVPRRPA